MASQFGIRSLFRPFCSSSSSSTMRTSTTQHGLLTDVFRTAAAAATTTTSSPSAPPSSSLAARPTGRRTFTTTASALFAGSKKPSKGMKPQGKGLDQNAARALARKRRQQLASKLDPKVAGIMQFLYAASQARAPLRMARNRYLRHWTIHRAWMLFRRRQEEGREKEMMRLYASMSNACEVLRNMEGPGTRPQGWLFRKAMEKKGLWNKDAVPIEYARPLVETPGHRPWNHEWKRAKAKA